MKAEVDTGAWMRWNNLANAIADAARIELKIWDDDSTFRRIHEVTRWSLEPEWRRHSISLIELHDAKYLPAIEAEIEWVVLKIRDELMAPVADLFEDYLWFEEDEPEPSITWNKAVGEILSLEQDENGLTITWRPYDIH